ncbi:hypothetical protein [Nitrososphaera sp.]|uniref:hypothetical protein n=1 Tax=Nitrososphaera sp. TaxID=1971748 RepID=UPI002ED7FF44
MQVNITQFNVQLYFKKPVLDSERLDDAFTAAEGFSANQVARDYGTHPMQGTTAFSREGFRIAPVQSNVLPFRILQVTSFPNVLQEQDAETLACVRFVAGRLQERLNIDPENDICVVRVVSHCIVNGSPDIHRVLSKLTSIDNIPSLAGKFVAHKNPMDAIQLVTRTGGELFHSDWSDIRVSQFNESSYVVTIFNETSSLASALESIAGVKQFVATMMQEMEQASG